MSEQISTGCRLSVRHGRGVNDVGEDGVEGRPLHGGVPVWREFIIH